MLFNKYKITMKYGSKMKIKIETSLSYHTDLD